MADLAGYLELTVGQRGSSSGCPRRSPVGGRQVAFLPAETLLSLAASFLANHRRFGGTAAHRAGTRSEWASARRRSFRRGSHGCRVVTAARNRRSRHQLCWQVVLAGGGLMDPLSMFASAALTEGVKFLYQQASEFLSAWRARRHDKDAPPPRALDAPEGVTVTRPCPLADPPSEATVRLLEQLRELVEPIQSGKVDTASPAARATIEQLRDVVEAALQAPVRLAGEPPRPLKISDIGVVTGRVMSRVAGLRADLAKLPGGSEITGVHIKTDDVESGGDVTGVELT